MPRLPAFSFTRRPSLTLQILMGVLIPVTIVIALIGLVAYVSAQEEIGEVYDSQLITSAEELWRLTRGNGDPDDLIIGTEELGLNAADRESLAEYAQWRSFRVWKNGAAVVSSQNAPDATVPVGRKGLRYETMSGETWRVFTLVEPADRVTVEVREKMSARREVSGRIVWGVSLPLLLVMPIIIIAVWLAILWGLRDLRRFAADVRSRSVENLARLPTENVARELAPLSDSLNDLLGKLEHSLSLERLFIDNAAHELRTPLAALAVQVEVARNARTAPERRVLLDDLLEGVNRASRLLDQLLTLARIQHTGAGTRALNLHRLTTDIVAESYVKARERSVEITLASPDDVEIASRPTLVRLLISNIVDNAIKYSHPGGRIDITVERAGTGAIWRCRDHGPGIPEAERENVFGRFYRMKGMTAPGSGLGLSIVKGICELLRADIRLLSPAQGSGLLVEVQLP